MLGGTFLQEKNQRKSAVGRLSSQATTRTGLFSNLLALVLVVPTFSSLKNSPDLSQLLVLFLKVVRIYVCEGKRKQTCKL